MFPLKACPPPPAVFLENVSTHSLCPISTQTERDGHTRNVHGDASLVAVAAAGGGAQSQSLSSERGEFLLGANTGLL